MAIFHTYIDDSTPGGEDAVAGISSDTLYGVFASRDFKVTGISTFSGSTEFEKVKHLKDSTGDIGNSGQILASTGSGINWIDANTTNVNSASNIGVNEDSTNAEQWLTFVGAKSGNNPIRADDDLKYNPSTNILTVSNVQLPDLGELRLGGSEELKIFHKPDTNDLRVEVQTGTNYILLGDTIDIKNAAGDKPLITSTGGAGTPEVILSHDGNERLKTTDAGVTVSGTVSATTFSGALDGSASGSSGSCTGNAATATALATAVNIGGVSFDGSADITPGVAGGLSGTPSIEVTNIDIAGTITDKDDITGDAGQVLTSTSTGVAWANAGTLAAGAAAQVAVSDQSGSEADETCFPIFGLDATGSNIALQSNTALKFNARTGALEATSLVKTSGTSSEFLKADGSVDTNTYLTSQVQSDWDQTTNTADDFIKNKPSIPAAQVQSDWDASSGMGEILNKPTLVTAFTGLSDTPANYTSQTGKFVAVKSDGTGLEFVNNPDTQRGIDTTPAETATTESISSSWAFAHAAATGNSGHVPAAGTGNSAKFLANDGTWKTPSYTTNTWRGIDDTPADGVTTESISSNWAFDHAGATGNSGHVPAAGTGNSGKFLANDGTWQTPSYTTNTNTTYGLLVPESTTAIRLNPSSGTADDITITGGTNVTVTRSSGTELTFSSVNTTYSNFSTSSAGLVPVSPGGTTKYLRADGSWTTISAESVRIRTDSVDGWHNLVFVDSTTDNEFQVLKMDDEASRLQWNPNTETLASYASQSLYIRQWSDGASGSAGQVLTSGGASGWAWTDYGISTTANFSQNGGTTTGLSSASTLVFGTTLGQRFGFYNYGSNQNVYLRTSNSSSYNYGTLRIRSDRGNTGGAQPIYGSDSGSSICMAQYDGDVMLCSGTGNFNIGGFQSSTSIAGWHFDVTGMAKCCVDQNSSNPNCKMWRHSNGDALTFIERGTYAWDVEVGSIEINISAMTTTYNTTSDYRLKENIVNVTGALAKINQLRPVNFNMIGNSQKMDGFIAHEVQAIIPYAVKGNKDAVKTVKDVDESDDGSIEDAARIDAAPTKEVPDYQQLDYSKLVGLLTASVQELSAKNDALEARIAALES